ncbi:MAG: hypothetical protein ABI896_11035 [Actinomycetota bacterium]
MHDPRQNVRTPIRRVTGPSCAGNVVCEAERYLALVDVFRAEGCEPRWRAEPHLRRAASRPRARAGAN